MVQQAASTTKSKQLGTQNGSTLQLMTPIAEAEEHREKIKSVLRTNLCSVVVCLINMNYLTGESAHTRTI